MPDECNTEFKGNDNDNGNGNDNDDDEEEEEDDRSGGEFKKQLPPIR